MTESFLADQTAGRRREGANERMARGDGEQGAEHAGRGVHGALWSLIAPPARAGEAGETQSKKYGTLLRVNVTRPAVTTILRGAISDSF